VVEGLGWGVPVTERVEVQTVLGVAVTERVEEEMVLGLGVVTEREGVATEWGEVVTEAEAATEWGEVATEAEVAQGETAEEDMMGEAVRVEETGHHAACRARLLQQQ